MNTKRYKYTLIELIVVLAVISILTSLLVTVLEKGRESIKLSGCVDNFKQLTAGVIVYSGDFAGYLPSSLPDKPVSNPNATRTFQLRMQVGGVKYATGLGRLFETGIFSNEDIELVFCPGWEAQSSSQYGTHGWFSAMYDEIFEQNKGFEEITSAYRGTSTVYCSVENSIYNPGNNYNGKTSLPISSPYYETHPVIMMDYMHDFFDANKGYGGGETHNFQRNNLARIDGSVRPMDVDSIFDQISYQIFNTRNYQHDHAIWDESGNLE